MNACPYIFSYIKVKIQLSSLKLYVIFFLLPANLWKCVPATQCRKNLIIKIINSARERKHSKKEEVLKSTKLSSERKIKLFMDDSLREQFQE